MDKIIDPVEISVLKKELSKDWVRDICVNDLYGSEDYTSFWNSNTTLIKVIDIDEEGFVSFKGPESDLLLEYDLDIVESGLSWRDKRISKVQSCNYIDERVVSCTTQDNFEVKGIRGIFTEDDVAPYLNQER